MDGFAFVIALLLMLVGLIGVVLPFFPGLALVWLGALVYGLMSGFGSVGWSFMIAITLLMAGGIVAGIVLPHQRVGAAGAPKSTLVTGIVLGVVGFFVIPIIGLPLGAALGVLLAERSRSNDWGVAWASTKTLIIGFGIGVLVQFVAGLAMVGCWVAWVLVR